MIVSSPLSSSRLNRPSKLCQSKATAFCDGVVSVWPWPSPNYHFGSIPNRSDPN